MKEDIGDLAQHMGRVQSARRDLRDLGMVWQMIESSAAISCPEEADGVLPTLIRTRERFDGLQERLVAAMAAESRDALGDQLSAKAQCAIDILVRNLFERTADVGFLATDDAVRAFCAAAPGDRHAGRAQMVQRLRDYQSKYTVYDDVILLAPEGEVLARIDDAAAIGASHDPIVRDAVGTAGYVERYGATDLAAGGAAALLYAHRIAGPSGGCVGVLVLRFRFVDEMHFVFASMAQDDGEIALVLVDDTRRVIVSNDDAHVPPGARLAPLPEQRVCLTHFAGREYLAVSCASQGYQGYAGPRWRAQAMVSLLTAFRAGREPPAESADDVPLDNESLRRIGAQAVEIHRDLRRVVWNGQLRGSGQRRAGGSRRLKAVLQQVEQAGRRTRLRVDHAIRDLHATSLVRARRQVHELARLAIDIMDRNLYERANDCRWWALSPALARLLEAPAADDNRAAIDALLDHVNGLYTVYTRLVAFDAEGTIRGASRRQADPDGPGESIAADWLEAARRLADPQRYHVGAFGPTALHGAGETYVYLAAVRGEGRERAFLGGIAIVFHAAREFRAMLADVLGDRTGVAAFCEADGRVLAATDRPLAEALQASLRDGAGLAVHDGVHYAVARVAGVGYREFKTSDGYDNGVHAFVALRLGTQERRRVAFSERRIVARPVPPRSPIVEAAIFQVGPMRCALPSAAVVASFDPAGAVRMPAAMAPTVGLLEVDVAGAHAVVPLVSGRALLGIGYPPRRGDGVVLVLRHPAADGERWWGLVVDDVLTVLDVAEHDRQPPPAGFDRYLPGLAGLLQVEAGEGAQREQLLLQLLDPERIADSCGVAAAPVNGSADRGEENDADHGAAIAAIAAVDVQYTSGT